MNLSLILSFSLLTAIDFKHNEKLISSVLKLDPNSFRADPEGIYTPIESKDYQYLIFTNDFSEIYGFNGLTNVAVFLDSTFAVTNLSIVESEDTRTYVRRVKRRKFLNQFIGFGYSGDIVPVTGATITSDAVKESVKTSINKLKQLIKN